MPREKLHLQRSAIEHHKQVGKDLLPPFQQLNSQMEQVFWLRDLLPEFLWIDALVLHYGQPTCVRVFNEFLSAADPYNSHPTEILDGTIGAFRFIPSVDRTAFIEDLSEEIETAVVRPFAHVIGLYPECPLAWMVPDTPANPKSAISCVRDAYSRLFPGKDSHAGFCRALPLNRMFAHNKIFIASHLKETIDAIERYPHGDKYRAESFARTTHNMMLSNRAKEDPATFAWAATFWNSNRTLVTCKYD